jgi:hypothetical protein
VLDKIPACTTGECLVSGGWRYDKNNRQNNDDHRSYYVTDELGAGQVRENVAEEPADPAKPPLVLSVVFRAASMAWFAMPVVSPPVVSPWRIAINGSYERAT